jgi:hypothetical protein
MSAGCARGMVNGAWVRGELVGASGDHTALFQALNVSHRPTNCDVSLEWPVF